MVVKAYVLFKVSSGSEREICENIMENNEVLDVTILYGEYDIIAKVNAQDSERIDSVIEKIQTIPSIILTSTMIVAREYRGKMKRNPDHKNR